MKAYSMQNKKAWEYNAYEFWVKQAGTPADRAKQDREDPVGMLKKYADYFDTYSGMKIANIEMQVNPGSCRHFKRIPLIILRNIKDRDIRSQNSQRNRLLSTGTAYATYWRSISRSTEVILI